MSLKKIFSVYLSAITSAIGWRQFIHSLPTDEGRPMLLPARTPSRYASAPGRVFCLYGGLAAAVKFYRRRHDHPRDTAVAGRLSRCAVVADQWLYADFRQLFAGRRGDGGCHRQKTYFYRRRRAVLPEQPAVLSDAQSLPVRRVEGAAGPGRGDDFSQRQRGAGPAV